MRLNGGKIDDDAVVNAIENNHLEMVKLLVEKGAEIDDNAINYAKTPEMKKYLIQASEVVYYEIEVTANNEAEAHEKVFLGNVEIPEPVDGSDFTIGRIDEI